MIADPLLLRDYHNQKEDVLSSEEAVKDFGFSIGLGHHNVTTGTPLQRHLLKVRTD